MLQTMFIEFFLLVVVFVAILASIANIMDLTLPYPLWGAACLFFLAFLLLIYVFFIYYLEECLCFSSIFLSSCVDVIYQFYFQLSFAHRSS
jgi:hypothetical protein